MFFYLHLTRPPPEQAHSSRPIFITPNIANDLRTEYPSPSPGPGGIDIFYAWVKCIEPAENQVDSVVRRHALGPMTQPQKLMTWTSNSYKEVQVFPPKEALQTPEGRWQLLLCIRTSHQTKGPYVASIDLSTENFGLNVFPILSAPVRFLASPRNLGKRRSDADKKQVRNERVFKLPSPLWNSASVGPLRVTEHLSYDLDKKIWDSGIGLSRWLILNMIMALSKEDSEMEANIPDIIKRLVQTKEGIILELGTGTGLVSIVLATLLNHCPQSPRSTIIATDLPSAMEILEANLSDNKECYPFVQVKPVVLDWDWQEDEMLPTEIARYEVDFIIMADVTYNIASFPSLIRTLSRLSRLRRDPAGGPSVLLAYKERDPDERRLWDITREIGLHFVEIGNIPGAGGMPVEIYSGTFENNKD